MKPGAMRGARSEWLCSLSSSFVNSLRMGRFIPSVALFDEDGRLTFFGVFAALAGVVLFYVGGLLFFIYLAARRRMGEERIHPLSKPQAIAALASLSVLMLGGSGGQTTTAILEIVVLYLLVIAAILLILMVTPNQAEYFKGLWRAKKQGRDHLSWWDDLSLNRVVSRDRVRDRVWSPRPWPRTAVGAGQAAASGVGSSSGNFPLAIAIGVLVVAYFGLAHQYFLLRFGRRGATYFALFLFLAWLVPAGGRHDPGDGVDARGRWSRRARSCSA